MTAPPGPPATPSAPGPAAPAPSLGGPSEELFDPVVAAAPVARSLAPRLCAPMDGAGSCAWYHGIWPYLRRLGVTASPQRHEKFFLAALRVLAATGQFPRVLVSGTADHAMAAHVVRAFRSEGATPRLTVLDRCPTPIELCKWYGDQVGVPVVGWPGDVLVIAEGGPPAARFDVICTHSFLSQFPGEARPQLLTRWREMLRPGGKVVTTTRITPAVAAGDRLRFTDEQADQFCAGVAAAARRDGAGLDLSAEQLVVAARRFAEQTVAHPTPSVADVVTLFHRGGWRLDRLNVRRVGPGAVQDGSGPGTTQPALYAEIVASAG